jgi:hypothetical protein
VSPGLQRGVRGERGRRGVRARFRERHYTPATARVGLGLALAAGVCLVQLGPTAGSGADTSFVPGNGLAQAQAISLAPTTGGLNYAIILATSISNFEDTEAQSLSQTLDLGAIGTALEAQGCDGSAPVLNSSNVPPPVQAESVNGNQTLTSSITPQTSTDGLGLGNESATATTQPSSSSTTSVQNITVPGGLLTVNGLTTSSHASIDNGNTRTATATADIQQVSVAGGAVVLGGLQWSATNVSGASSQSTTSFSLGSMTVAGVPQNVSAMSPQSELSIVNTALAPIGLNVQWPAQTTLPDGTVVISPMVVGIDNNALGQEVIGANLNTLQPVRTALVNALLSANCNFADAFLVGDIGIGVLAGGGNLNVELGGANALTNDLAAVSPFGPGTLPPAASSSAPASLPGNTGNTGTAPLAAPVVPAIGNTSAPPPTLTNTAPATQGSSGGGKEALGPLLRTTACVSLGPSGGGCNSGNLAVPIGLIALAVVVALFTWDYLRQRRRARLKGLELSA